MSDIYLERILNNLVDSYYPELCNANIEIDYVSAYRARGFFLQTYPEKGNGGRLSHYPIDVNPMLRKARSEVKRGGIAHELEHIVCWENNHQGINRNMRCYENYKCYRDSDERDSDLRVILRGLGEEILYFFSYAKRRRHLLNGTTEISGLSEEEIRMLTHIRKRTGIKRVLI